MLFCFVCSHRLSLTSSSSSSFFVQVLGQQKKTLAGFSTAAVLPHTGFIYYSEIVQSVPPVSGGGREGGRDGKLPRERGEGREMVKGKREGGGKRDVVSCTSHHRMQEEKWRR